MIVLIEMIIFVKKSRNLTKEVFPGKIRMCELCDFCVHFRLLAECKQRKFKITDSSASQANKEKKRGGGEIDFLGQEILYNSVCPYLAVSQSQGILFDTFINFPKKKNICYYVKIISNQNIVIFWPGVSRGFQFMFNVPSYVLLRYYI